MAELPKRRSYQGWVGAFAKRDYVVLKAARLAEDQCSGGISWPLLTLANGVTDRALTNADHAGVPDLIQRHRRTGCPGTFYSRNLRLAVRPHDMQSSPLS